jgi:hypothetical protein
VAAARLTDEVLIEKPYKLRELPQIVQTAQKSLLEVEY